MGKWRRRLYVFFIFLLAVLSTLRLGDEVAQARNLRGVAQFITDAGLEKYALYDSSAKQALGELQRFIVERNLSVPLFALDGKKKKVCIAITTARRVNSPYSYLVQAVVSLIARMPYMARRDDVYIHVFNVEHNPETNPDIPLIEGLLPVTNVKVSIPMSKTMLPRKYVEALHHAEVMKTVAGWDCEFPILLEDDGLAGEGWLDGVDLASTQLTDWFLVKLFTARRGKYPSGPAGVTNYDQGFNTVALMISPQYLRVLAERQRREVLETIESHDFDRFEAKDLFLNDFRRKHALKIQAFEPSLFQHTGVYSSFHARDMHHFAWYMEARNFASDKKPIVFNQTLFFAGS